MRNDVNARLATEYPQFPINPIESVGKQLEKADAVMDKASGMLIKARGLYEVAKPFTIDPVVAGCSWFQIQWGDYVVASLRQGLEDTEDMKLAAIEYDKEVQDHIERLGQYALEISKKRGDCRRTYEASQKYKPPEPSDAPMRKAIARQDKFLCLTAAIGVFAVPSARYATEYSMPLVKDIQNPFGRALASDAIVISGFSVIVSGMGRLLITQNLAGGAKVGLKVSITMIALYEATRLFRYGMKESGLADRLPECIGKFFK